MWDPSGWDHNAVCTGPREILVIEAEQFWRQTEHGGTGKAHRRRKIERSKQERAGRPGLGGSEQLTEIYTKKTTDSHQRYKSKSKNRTKDWMGEKTPSREEWRTEAGEPEKGEDSVVLCCDRINCVLGGGWTREGGKICRARCCHTFA